MPTVYFVCIGNTCRSPMAAAIFNQIARERGIEGVRADSFGIVPFYGDSDDVRQLRESAVCEVMGRVDGLSNHRPKGIEGIAFKEGDRIVLLDSGRFNELGAGILRNPSFQGKPFPLLVIETEDPFGGSVEDYIDCCLFLKEGIEENFDPFLDFRRMPHLAFDGIGVRVSSHFFTIFARYRIHSSGGKRYEVERNLVQEGEFFISKVRDSYPIPKDLECRRHSFIALGGK